MINNRGHALAFNSNPIDENSSLDSSVYNSIINNLKSSTLRCINRSRDLNYKLMKFNKALTAENHNMMSVYNSMQIKYNEPSLQSQSSIITGFDTSAAEDKLVRLVEYANVDFDHLTGQIVMAPNTTGNSKWSKVVRYLDRDGKSRASKDIRIMFGNTNVDFTDTTNLVELPDDSDIYSMLDGYSDTFWLADVTSNSNYKLQIQFPASLKPFVSYLSLIPFPAFGFSIDSVYITDSSNTSHRIDDTTSNEMGILNTHFKPMSWGGTLVINLVAKGNTIGIADLDIGLEDYFQSNTDNTAAATDRTLSSYMVYELTSNFKTDPITYISGINLFDFSLYGQTTDAYALKKSNYITATVYKVSPLLDWSNSLIGKDINPDTLYTGTQPDNKKWTKIDKSAGDRLFIKFTIKKYLGQTPTFRGVMVSYEK